MTITSHNHLEAISYRPSNHEDLTHHLDGGRGYCSTEVILNCQKIMNHESQDLYLSLSYYTSRTQITRMGLFICIGNHDLKINAFINLILKI